MPALLSRVLLWHCRPGDTNRSWAQQRRVACGWHLISCFPGVYLPACSLLLQITVEHSGARSSTQKMETVWLEKLQPGAKWSHEGKLKRGFLSCPRKKRSSAAVTGSYVAVILSCAEWEPEKRLDRTGALLLISEYDWMKMKFQCLPACKIYYHRNRKFPRGGNWRARFKEK